jgi:hypothetical protein
VACRYVALTKLHTCFVIPIGLCNVEVSSPALYTLCKENEMKRILSILALAVGLVGVAPAEAHWHGGGGWGWHRGWGAPVIGAAIVGTAVYAATGPRYVTVYPPVVVNQPPIYMGQTAARAAYFCPTSQQYYPNVPACDVPWQLVSY